MMKFVLGGRGQLRCPSDFLCHNDGLCDSNGSCICKPGWTGDMCELEAIPCPTQPCVNGNCETDGEGRKYCQCDHRFEGEFCELDKDECALKVCPADAECLNHMPKHDKDKICFLYTSTFVSKFSSFIEDIHVSVLLAILVISGGNYCHNGGVCEARYVCMCRDGFGGPRCDHRVPLHRAYEEFGCPERPEVCAKLFDDGHCDEICNRESCLFDGFDCAKSDDRVCRNPSDCAYKYGDGECDEECAGAECGYDGGDCEKTNGTGAGSDGNMIGVAVGVPPDVAVKNLRQLQAELAQRLYTHVRLAEDNEGVMVFEWSMDSGQGNRISVIDEQIVVVDMNITINGTMVFFDVDTSGCRLRRRQNHVQPQCFTDLRAAATYLTLELARVRPSNEEVLPIRDITWRKRQLVAVPLMSPVTFAIISSVLFVAICTICTGVIVAIVRVRRKRKKTVFAPYWSIPEESPLLLAVRRGDHDSVQHMILSSENFIDAIFERNAAGQSPLLFAARLAHPDLECVSILVKAIDEVRKRRHDDVLSEHFNDLEANRRDLLKMLPLHDEADAKYALTDTLVSSRRSVL
ncbi:notch domain protein [Necator americanus]|uniref:Notch domain protein n=1 Tax=Necator americanus TaxID=51031 RepID=W2TRF3_NECAM|nr:notch domain protein [Necator americanus]ETN84630.1 notch domain protein [Necator americanus]